MTPPSITPEHRGSELRFVLVDQAHDAAVIGEVTYVDLMRDEATHRILYHTEVSPEYGGQGLAATLVEHAVTASIADGFKLVAVCPYVTKWLQDRPDLAEHVVRPQPRHLEAIRR